MKLRIAVCDEKKTTWEKVQKQIKKTRPGYCVDIYEAGTIFLTSDIEYDVIFLGEISDMSVMELAKSFREKSNREYLIFLTSHIEYMVEAFKVKAFRVLKRPLSLADLDEALCGLENEISCERKVAVTMQGVTNVIPFQDISCFEAYGDGTYIYTRQGVFESHKPLNYWMKEMESKFFCQVHRSYFVSLKHVKSFGNGKIELQFMNMPVEISKRRFPEVKRRLLSMYNKI